MDCRNVADILDARVESRLSSDERCAVDAHLSGCESCRRAWRAQTALLALPMPAAPTDLLHRVLAAVARRDPRRRRSGVFAGTMLLAAGAALAAIVAVTASKFVKSTNPAKLPVPTTTAVPSAPAKGDLDSTAPGDSQPSAGARPSPGTPNVIDLPDALLLPLIRTPPYYPRQALEQRLNGDVTVRFTVTAIGTVENVVAVESSDPIFAPPAVVAVSQWKYLPKVVGGKRAAVRDITTVIRFQLAPDDSKSSKSPETRRPEDVPPAFVPPGRISSKDFDAVIERAWERVSMNDLRHAELILDELRATYELDSPQTASVWHFYGYIYTQYSDFGRAIAAYQTAVAAVESANTGSWSAYFVELAHLYFARNQYDMALRTLLRYTKRTDGRHVDPAATVFIERLRQLGITEETL
jgi:TonB family protein